MLFCILIKRSNEDNFSIEVPEFRKRNTALANVDHTGIELSDDIDLGLGRNIHIAATGVAGVGEKVYRLRAVTRTLDRHGQVMPGQKRIGSDSHDRQPETGPWDFSGRRFRHTAIARAQQANRSDEDIPPEESHYFAAGIFGAAPMASRPASAQASSR